MGESGSENPRIVLLFCGKRKSGKDYLTECLVKHLNKTYSDDKAVILRLSGPLKQCYAEDHGLDFEKLLDASDYKEKHRKPMIEWSEKIRDENPAYFCDKSIEMYKGKNYPIWIVSDCRRKTDFDYFDSNYSGRNKKVRVIASQEVRDKRGFVFQDGVDNAESECGLDKESCDYEVENNGALPAEEILCNIMQYIKNQLTL